MIGDNIKKIRLNKNIGLNKTANLAGISGSYLSNIEKGLKENPSMEVLHKIANVLDVPVNAFFDEDFSIKTIQNSEIETIITYLSTNNITDKQIKLLKSYMNILFDEEF